MSATVRRRRRTVEERIGAQLRHGKPGDLQGRGEPLKRDRGAIVSRAGGPSGGDSGTVIEHLTAYPTAGQTVAAGSGQVMFDREAAPPTERRGFRTFSARLAADGEVGDIPIDVRGLLKVGLRLPFSHNADATCTVERIRNSAVLTIVESSGRCAGFVGSKDCWVAPDDAIRVTITADRDVLFATGGADPLIELTVWHDDRSTSDLPQWVRVTDADVWGLVRLDGSWWTTEGNSGDTVTEYDDDWAILSSFEAGTGNDRVRGITTDGTDLWVTGDGTLGGDEQIIQRTTGGVLQSSFATGPANDTANRGLVHDVTDLWLVEGTANEVEQWSAAGALLSAFSLPVGAAHHGMTLHDGLLYVVDGTNANVLVYETDGTLLRTIDVSGATSSPTGIEIVDGSLYISQDGVGVWRRRTGAM